jgi:hypothetical protein
MKMELHPTIVITLILLNFTVFGCASMPPYDPVTYGRLTDLKVLTSNLYNLPPDAPWNVDQVNEIETKLNQVYEYEIGKGNGNKLTVDQVEILTQAFEGDVKLRRDEGKWKQKYAEQQKLRIIKDYQNAIDAENGKLHS